MTATRITAPLGRTSAPDALARIGDIVQPALRAAVSTMPDDRMRLIASYQLGWCDAEGRATDGGGKAIRPALAILSAEAVLGRPDCGIPGAVAVELVHNFSLLHDDVMDHDVTRRHRPTGWVAFGEGDAILAGNAMLTLAVQVLIQTGIEGRRSLPHLMEATQRLISGQSRDLELENRDAVQTHEVLAMEAGKTAALLACVVHRRARRRRAGAHRPGPGGIRLRGRHGVPARRRPPGGRRRPTTHRQIRIVRRARRQAERPHRRRIDQ